MEFATEEKHSYKVVDDTVSITPSHSYPFFDRLGQFQDTNSFCDVILQAISDDPQENRDGSIPYRKKLRNSALKNVKNEMKEAEKWSKIPVHSCVIAASSSVLQNKLLKLFIGNKDKVCSFKNIKMKHLKICIDFIYKKPVSFLKEETDSVLAAAKNLGLVDLVHWCKITQQKTKLCITLDADGTDSEKDIKPDLCDIDQHAVPDSSYKSLNKICDSSLDKNITNCNEGKFEIDNANLSTDTDVPQFEDTKATMQTVLDLDNQDFSANAIPESDDSDNDVDNLDNNMLWEIEDLNTVSWNVKEDEDDTDEYYNNDSEPDYLGNPPLTTGDVEMEPINIYHCSHCNQDFSTGNHFCDVVNKKARLRINYCCQYCGIIITSRHFADHEKRHLQVRNYKCEHCDYAGVSKQRLVEHQTKHSNEKRYKCDHCEKVYKYPSALREHEIVTHYAALGINYKKTDNLPYKCPVCEFRCSAHAIAIRHVKTNHANRNSDEVKHFLELHTKSPSKHEAKSDKYSIVAKELPGLCQVVTINKLMGNNTMATSLENSSRCVEFNTIKNNFKETVALENFGNTFECENMGTTFENENLGNTFENDKIEVVSEMPECNSNSDQVKPDTVLSPARQLLTGEQEMDM